jgi:hypothetical protein
MTTFSVSQSGTTVQITSTASGFTQNSLYQYYLNSGDLSLGTNSFVITFGDGASIRLTDFSEIPYVTGGSSSTQSVLGIPATAEGGFTNSINLIGGYGYQSTFDVFDNISGALLIDNYEPQDNSTYFEPYVLIGYSSGSLTLNAPRSTAGVGSASIGATGLGSFTPAVNSYVGGAGGTAVNQLSSGGGALPWVFTLTVPSAPVPICFLEGSLILMSDGQHKKIENLKIGEWVLTTMGARQIKWVPRRHYTNSVLKLFPQTLPIRFKVSSLGGNAPFRDLYVSPLHSMWVKGKRLFAKDLVNNVSIECSAADEYPSGVTYYHIELEQEGIIDANGALTSSFVCARNRSEFDNANEFALLYGDINMPTPEIEAWVTVGELKSIYKEIVCRTFASEENLMRC